MKVLLIKDVYKLGRAGDVKRVADGFGRNYLLPQGLAVLATQGAVKQSEHIRVKAAAQRIQLNTEKSGLAEQIAKITLVFASKAGENGKLYGSITTQMIAEGISAKVGAQIDRHQIDVTPIRTLGEHKARVHLTVDLTPEVQIIVHREGEAIELPVEEGLAQPVVVEEKAE